MGSIEEPFWDQTGYHEQLKIWEAARNEPKKTQKKPPICELGKYVNSFLGNLDE